MVDILTRNFSLLHDEDRKHYVEKKFPPPSLAMIRILLSEKFGKDYSIKEILTLLREEGCLKPKAYGIPPWYSEKWLVNGKDVQEESENLVR